MTDIKGKSFIAVLQCEGLGAIGFIDFLRSRDVAQEGWLVQGRQRSDNYLTFQFDYVGGTENRLHYKIYGGPTAGAYEGKPLGLSRNGYLGFYDRDPGVDFWKVELAETPEEPDSFEFYLRDNEGKRVAVKEGRRGNFFFGIGGKDAHARVRFLNVDDGDIGYFGAKIIEYN